MKYNLMLKRNINIQKPSSQEFLGFFQMSILFSMVKTVRIEHVNNDIAVFCMNYSNFYSGLRIS
jgi:hypothetical protein